jgi:hypothetical protein
VVKAQRRPGQTTWPPTVTDAAPIGLRSWPRRSIRFLERTLPSGPLRSLTSQLDVHPDLDHLLDRHAEAAEGG